MDKWRPTHRSAARRKQSSLPSVCHRRLLETPGWEEVRMRANPPVKRLEIKRHLFTPGRRKFCRTSLSRTVRIGFKGEINDRARSGKDIERTHTEREEPLSQMFLL